MAAYRPDIPPHVVEVIRHLPPDIKRSIKQALRSLSADLISGVPLMRKLSGLWKYKVRRFRIIFELYRKARIIRIYAVGHRREVYEKIGRPHPRSLAEELATGHTQCRTLASVFRAGEIFRPETIGTVGTAGTIGTDFF